MTERLSTLMDGELGTREAGLAIRECCAEEDLRQTWLAYHQIGEAMRGERACSAGSTRRIMEAIAREPTVLAPRWRASAGAGRIAFAAAASAATLAVVAWIGVQDGGTPSRGPTVASSAPQAPAPARTAVANVVPLNKVNEYLVVHRQVPDAEFYRTVSNQAAVGR